MEKRIAKISFLGDISFNDAYKNTSEEFEKYFGKIADSLMDSDFVIGNLECFAEGNEGINRAKVPRLSTSDKMLQQLHKLNLSAATLANNHVYDNLYSGFSKTLEILKNQNIRFLGAGVTNELAAQPLLFDINNIRFCLLNYVTEDTNPKLPDNSKIKLNYLKIDSAVEEIKKYKSSSDFIILTLHWGGKYERSFYPGAEQHIILRKLIDAGADLIIGHHSHTLQPFEIIDGKYVFYSIGNFCFADVYTDGKVYALDKRKNLDSIILKVNFVEDRYTVDIFPFMNKDLQLIPNPKPLNRLKRRNIFLKIFKKLPFLRKIYFLKYRYYDPLYYYLFFDKRTLSEKMKSFNIQKIGKFLFKKNEKSKNE